MPTIVSYLLLRRLIYTLVKYEILLSAAEYVAPFAMRLSLHCPPCGPPCHLRCMLIQHQERFPNLCLKTNLCNMIRACHMYFKLSNFLSYELFKIKFLGSMFCISDDGQQLFKRHSIFECGSVFKIRKELKFVSSFA